MSHTINPETSPDCPRCKKEMEIRAVGDTCSSGINIPDAPKRSDIAFNLYVCDGCMVVARENVWDFEGVVFIMPEQLPA